MTLAALRAIFAVTIVATSAARATPRPAAPAHVRFVPPTLDLGEWGAGRAATASVWLINTGDQPAALTRVEVEAGGLELRPVLPTKLAPAGAIEFRVSLTADDTIDTVRTRHVTAHLAGLTPVTFDVSVRSIHPDVHLPPPAADRHAWAPIRATPPVLDFGPAAPGERKAASIWLVNAADTPARLVAAKGGCGCIEFPDFAPATIDPGRAIELRPTMIAQGDVGSNRFKFTNFVFEDLEPLAVEFHMQIVDPRVSKLRRFIDARERGDLAAMRVCMTLDSRIWRGQRTGPGIARTTDGAPPAAAWDEAMNTTHRYGAFRLEDRAVTVRVTETSDFHRLVGCPPHTTRHTYFFDDDRMIEALVITTEPDDVSPPEACLTEFIKWAQQHHARQLEAIYGGGRVTRTAASAPRWRAALVAWRRATGRPAIDLEGAPWE